MTANEKYLSNFFKPYAAFDYKINTLITISVRRTDGNNVYDLPRNNINKIHEPL